VGRDEPRTNPPLAVKAVAFAFGVALLACVGYLLYEATPGIAEALCAKVGAECPPGYADAFRVGFLVVVTVTLVLASIEYWVGR